MRRHADKPTLARWLRDLLCGVLIGAGAILPGVSGGVLAVVFDIYQPFMELLTHPRRALPKYWKFIPALVLGWIVGFLGFAKGISAAMTLSGTVTTWLFIGLIAGTAPALYREAGKEGRSKTSFLSMFLCAGAIFAGLFYLSRVAAVQVTPSFWWYVLCGGLWGLGVVVPGLATSSVLMALGLYQPIMDGLSSLNPGVLLPSVAGMAVTIILLARLVSWFFRRNYSVAFHGIFGIVAASTLVIIPTAYSGPGEIALSALCAAAGCGLALLMGRLQKAENAGS